MRAGIDSYSYHRRYGEIRLGEVVPAIAPPWPLEPSPVLAHARTTGAADLYLETCYLPEPETITPETLATGAPLTIGFSWGHPWPAGAFHGLDGGRTPAAEDHLGRWITLAASLGHPLMRITLGSPASRGTEPAAVLVDRLIAPTARAAERAARVGLKLAIENHGDLRAQDLLEVLERVGSPDLGVTLDNVNLIRVGDDMIEGTRMLAPRTMLVQLKDHPFEPNPRREGGAQSVALGDGVAPLEDLIAILAATGYGGAVCVELASLGGEDVDELAMIERSVDWLRAHLP